MSLRWKLALAMAALALAITAVFGYSSYGATRNGLYASVDRSLESATFAEAVRGAPPGRRGDGGGDDGGDRNDRGDRGYNYQVVNRDGSIFVSTFADPPEVESWAYSVLDGKPRDRFDTIEHDGERYRVRTLPGRDRDAFLQVFRSLEETDEVLARLRIRTLGLAVAIGTIAALLGWWFADRLTAPLRRLTLATEHVAATGDLDVEVAAEGDDEVGRLAGGFNSMMIALRSSRDDQARLVQDAGHELRTPLTSLRTNIDLLGRYPDLAADERSKILSDVHTETEELTDLVNEIVAIASGELDDEPVTTADLRMIADDVADRFRRRTDRTIAVTGTETAPVAGQPRAINRAISCLVENAIKFDPDDGEIELAVDAHSIGVLDRGPGLGEVDAHKLFDRFYRAESSKALPGSGLGLSIVKQVADNHGGSVTAAGRDGGGAAFLFTVPAGSPPDHTGNSASKVAGTHRDELPPPKVDS